MKHLNVSSIVKFLLKALSFCVSFVLLFYLFQMFLTPKFQGEATTMVDGLKQQTDTKELDVLFLGSSQMFCAVDSKTLTEEYGIISYNYGASSQCLTSTAYYFEEALKHSSPKYVFVELGNIFHANKDVDDTALTWNYAPADMSMSKYRSVYSITQDPKRSFEYSFCPLFLYHSRWNEINQEDIKYYQNYYNPETYMNRGFLERDKVVPQEMKYDKEINHELEVPKESVAALEKIEKICAENNIKLVCFKIPVPFWTQTHARVTADLMRETGYDYLDLYDYLDEIAIDENKDYRDDHHANIYGAKKITDCLGSLLHSRYD